MSSKIFGKKLLALLLATGLCASLAAPAYAVSWSSSSRSGSAFSNFWSRLFGGGQQSEFNLVEDDSTVTAGTELRADTYEAAAPRAETTLKYFPVTLYNYDQTTFNNATHQIEVDKALTDGEINTLNQWRGVYFGDMYNKFDRYSYGSSDATYKPVSVPYYNRNNRQWTNGSYYVYDNGNYYVCTGLSCYRSVSGREYTYSWTATYSGGTAKGSGSFYTLYQNSGSTQQTGPLRYADWNYWTGNIQDSSKSGNRTYSGMVENTLDASKNIQFKYPDAGIFTDDARNKNVYTNVGLPFVYTEDDGYYTFDADQFGAYFHEDDKQGTSSTPASNTNLYYSATPQSHNYSAQDGRKRGWFPYNNTTNVDTAKADYYFGMNATIPFTMTQSGRMDDSDPNSAPIKFEFSGDDDVWVFIDGKLVLDMGGIKNCLDSEINFAENTFRITKPSTNGGGQLGDASSANNANLSGKLFNDDKGEGILGMTRETFAATDEHNLTIFYLERGAGSSNCKIKFNLPYKDSVSVQKLITESKTNDGVVSPLTTAEQAMVDANDFGFTLYKGTSPVANATYVLYNKQGQAIGNPSTDANGHFTLKNGQTAKFIGRIDNNTYYVKEDGKDGYVTPDYTYSATAANGDTEVAPADGYTSMKVKVSGGSEAQDSLSFVCKNYLSANLPNPSNIPADDCIVIDYGLPVTIPNVLANDTWKGDSIKLTSVTEGKYGTAQINPDGTITYTLTKPLDGVATLTYTSVVTGTGNTGDQITTAPKEATGTIYVIPATSMYYEEDFGDMVTYTGAWETVGKGTNDQQEGYFVGDEKSSPYGSDAAYRDDSEDSNGTSKQVDTTNGAASFSYTFTGTGTTFFARTSNNSGYMRVVIKDAEGNTVYTAYRDTKYKTDDDTFTMYNIPVFTWEADNYGTYRVEVSIAEKVGKFGTAFNLDGIRVYNPIDAYNPTPGVPQQMAAAAYAADNEAHCTVATLRDKLISDDMVDKGNGLVWADEKGFVIFTDTNDEIKNASEYVSNGPKEEVYLNNGQSVTFSLAGWDANTNKIYLGMKAPTGSATVSINGHPVTLSNATDCYYDISSYATITEVDGKKIATFTVKATSELVSVTNIKVTGISEFAICKPKNENIDGAEGEGSDSNE